MATEDPRMEICEAMYTSRQWYRRGGDVVADIEEERRRRRRGERGRNKQRGVPSR